MQRDEQAWGPIPWGKAAVLIGVAIVSLLTVWPARGAGLVADDYFFVRTAASHDVARGFVDGWGHPLGQTRGLRPIATATYTLNARAAGSDPQGFRLVNFALYAINAMLVACVALAMTDASLAGLVAGLLFALHPTHHENVVWISGRPALLAVTFLLTGALILLRAQAAERRTTAASWLAAGCLLLALLSYEGAITGSLVLLGMLLCGVATSPRRLGALIAPSVLTTGAYLAWRFLVLTSVGRDTSYLVQADGATLATNAHHMAVRLFACGGCANIRPSFESSTFILTLVACVGAAALVWRWRSRAAAGLALIGAAGLLPFITAGGYSDRFVYFASLAPVLLLTLAVMPLRAIDVRRAAAAGLVLVVVSGLWGRQLRLLAGDWVRAGQIATDVLERFASAASRLDPSSEIYVFDVPTFFGEALVFPTYFFLAAQQQVGRPSLPIHERGSSHVGGAIARALAAKRPIDVVLRWDVELGDWTLVGDLGPGTLSP